MTDSDRNRMLELLHAIVVPELERRGFSGHFPDFRRANTDAVDLLSFHFARHTAAFAVEVACGPLAGATIGSPAIGGQLFVPADKLNVWHISPGSRFRLGPDQPDQWFRFARKFPFFGDPHKRAALALLAYLDSQAEVWWKQRAENAS